MTKGTPWIEYLSRQLEQARQEVFRLEEALKQASEDTGLEGVVFNPKTEASDSASSKQLSNIPIGPNSGLSDRAYIGLSNLSMETALDIHHNRSALETRLWERGVSRTTLKEVREWALTKGIQLEPCEAALEPELLLCAEEVERLSTVLVADSGLGVRARKALYKQGISSALDAYEEREDLLWRLSLQKGIGPATLTELHQWATDLKIQLNRQICRPWDLPNEATADNKVNCD